MISPCTLVCSIDMKTGYCFGCGRTRDEIAGWIDYSDAERQSIMDILAARLETVERKPRRETRRQKIARESAKERQTP
ncbi:DUF1289 domain-containing protein [Aliirhizobium smilacinae]|uniref:DUF1289 domain-containing protein n=1 Tax=Aliirhizobium smilacinae TaxID=1395944 RepID=A0A5C4XQI5_9HYPH|nr:DUF1289 domain-containing protein [Rhizobium smilacinae]TNM64854.1 DUF1289 domain-containing protein [Rhizobium smilacinae]